MNQGMAETRVICGCGGVMITMCVNLGEGVPDFVRCKHSAHGGGGGGLPQCACGRPCRLDHDRLRDAARGLLPRHMRRWRELGYIEVPCAQACS